MRWYRRTVTRPPAEQELVPAAVAPVAAAGFAGREIGAMVAGSILALAAVGLIVMSAASPSEEIVAGQAVDRPITLLPDGTLNPDVVDAIARAIEGDPTFTDVSELSDEDVRRIAAATGLPPEELAPILARLVATGSVAPLSTTPVVIPVAPPQAVAAIQVQRGTSTTYIPPPQAVVAVEVQRSTTTTYIPPPVVLAGK